MTTFTVSLTVIISLLWIVACIFMMLKELNSEQTASNKMKEDLKKASNEYFYTIRNFNASIGDLHL